MASPTPLISLPPDLANWRARLFDIPQSPQHLELTAQEYNLYSPYVDNVYTIDHKRTSKKAVVSYHDCRLCKRRPSSKATTVGDASDESRDFKRRKTKSRPAGLCLVRIKIEQFYTTSTETTAATEKVRITRLSEQGHTHDLDESDALKRNSVIKGVLRRELDKGKSPSNVLASLKLEKAALEISGGKWLKLQEVFNAKTSKTRSSSTADREEEPTMKESPSDTPPKDSTSQGWEMMNHPNFLPSERQRALVVASKLPNWPCFAIGDLQEGVMFHTPFLPAYFLNSSVLRLSKVNAHHLTSSLGCGSDPYLYSISARAPTGEYVPNIFILFSGGPGFFPMQNALCFVEQKFPLLRPKYMEVPFHSYTVFRNARSDPVAFVSTEMFISRSTMREHIDMMHPGFIEGLIRPLYSLATEEECGFIEFFPNYPSVGPKSDHGRSWALWNRLQDCELLQMFIDESIEVGAEQRSLDGLLEAIAARFATDVTEMDIPVEPHLQTKNFRELLPRHRPPSRRGGWWVHIPDLVHGELEKENKAAEGMIRVYERSNMMQLEGGAVFCRCIFARAYQLPCRHILAKCILLEVEVDWPIAGELYETMPEQGWEWYKGRGTSPPRFPIVGRPNADGSSHEDDGTSTGLGI
ncbi:hypothetical protein BJ508DRAFT_416372 [Ascobolus immersus RN42]|uniref:SWIM-type domain-containing protein n=1 Tax=Ascobolus immersus RN42 TaxID=1160509 RepID=A0A3N4I013_ASCIM|nr:hypothetical protein BJ508DRAFT_416372 [Ascobolus immersus RN42]